MDSKSIREKMTQGEWVVDDTYDVMCGELHLCVPYTRNPGQNIINAHAITSAVNGTYGISIDPRKVKEMYDMLQEVEREIAPYEDEEQRAIFSPICNKITALLTSATLAA